MPNRLLIRGATMITPSRVIEGQALLVEGDRISRIAPASEIPGPFDREIDGAGMVLLPGFVNSHMHFYSTFARGLGGVAPSRDFEEILTNLWWRLDRALTPDDVEASAEVALVDAIRAGTTTIVDHHASPNAIDGSLDRIAAAVKRVGLRASLCYEVSDRDGAERAAAGLAENDRFLRRCETERDPQLRGLLGLHASFTLSESTLERAAEIAAARSAGVHVHVAEAESDVRRTRDAHGESPVARFARHGLLGERSIAAHAVHVDDVDRALLAATGTFVAHNPQSNANNAVGTADVVAMVRAGVRVGLGTDAMTLNMLEELRAGLFAQHLKQGVPGAGWRELVDALFVRNGELATRLWGFPVGRLEVGAAADLVLVPYRPPTPLDDASAAGHLVFGLSQRAVDTTICGGRVLMEGRRLAIDLDEEALAARSRELACAFRARF